MRFIIEMPGSDWDERVFKNLRRFCTGLGASLIIPPPDIENRPFISDKPRRKPKAEDRETIMEIINRLAPSIGSRLTAVELGDALEENRLARNSGGSAMSRLIKQGIFHRIVDGQFERIKENG
jgi:hypothetical protein